MWKLVLIGIGLVGCDKPRDSVESSSTTAGSGTSPSVPGEARACPLTGGSPPSQVICRCGRVDMNNAPIAGMLVVGTGQYKPDSNLCRAAVHAGVIKRDGGLLRYATADYCYSFKDSTSNGIVSAFHGTGDLGFYFPDAAEPGGCSQKLRARVLPFDPDRKPADKPCPPTFAIDTDAKPQRCSCDAPIAATPVAGSNPYSLDSAPCIAAVHAGAIPATGGDISLEFFTSCAPLVATAAHGVSSHAAGAGGRVYWIHTGAERPAPCP